MHCTTKHYNTRQEMKCNAMQWKIGTKDSDIGLLIFYEDVINERFEIRLQNHSNATLSPTFAAQT